MAQLLWILLRPPSCLGGPRTKNICQADDPKHLPTPPGEPSDPELWGQLGEMGVGGLGAVRVCVWVHKVGGVKGSWEEGSLELWGHALEGS